MAVSHARIAVSGSTPTLLTTEGAEPVNSVTVQVQNLGEGFMYVGGQGVTTSSYGVAIAPGAAVTLNQLSPRDELYALAQNSGEFVAVLKVSR